MGSGFFLVTAFLAIAAFANLSALTLIFIRQRAKSPANILLAFYLMGIGLVMVTLYLIYTGLVIHVPWLYRLPSPLYYGMFPAAFLYVRMVVADERKFKVVWLLHFLPVLLHLIEMMPYYGQPMVAKAAHVAESLQNPANAWMHNEGWLTDFWHNIIRGLQAFIYGCLIIGQVRTVCKVRPSDCEHYKLVLQWLRVLGYSLLMFGGYIAVILLLRKHMTSDYQVMLLLGLVAILQILPASVMAATPQLLLGMPRIIQPYPLETAAKLEKADVQVQQSGITGLETEHVEDNGRMQNQYLEYMAQLSGFMQIDKPFLKPRYTSAELARDVGIPQYHITYLLSQVMHERFNDYINRHRIDYIKNQIDEDKAARLSLEGLALEAGFNSRVTFIRAVQKHTGQNPSEYFYAKPKAEDLSGNP